MDENPRMDKNPTKDGSMDDRWTIYGRKPSIDKPNQGWMCGRYMDEPNQGWTNPTKERMDDAS